MVGLWLIEGLCLAATSSTRLCSQPSRDPSMRSTILLAYFSLILSSGMGVLAQTEKAVCLPQHMDERILNSLHQDSCTIGSILDATCRNQTDYVYFKLEGNQSYPPPSAMLAGDFFCSCNSVIYNLRMSCSACQGGNIQYYGWAEWAASCPSENIYLLQYPHEIPQGTRIPHWALSGDTWSDHGWYDDISALGVGRNPEARPKKPGTSDGHSHTKAIIGGAVGGVIALAVIVIALFFVIRRSRKNRDENPRPKPRPRPRPRHPADAQWESIFTYNPSASGGRPTLVLNLPPEPYQPGSSSTPLPPRDTRQASAGPSTSPPPRTTRQTKAGPSTSPPPLNTHQTTAGPSTSPPVRSTRQTSAGPSTSPPPRSTHQTSSGPSTSPPPEGTPQTEPPVTHATPTRLEHVETNAPPLTPPPAYTPLGED